MLDPAFMQPSPQTPSTPSTSLPRLPTSTPTAAMKGREEEKKKKRQVTILRGLPNLEEWTGGFRDSNTHQTPQGHQ